jgi:hypothetical protein
MSFVFMAFRWPEPGSRDTLAQPMRELRNRQLKSRRWGGHAARPTGQLVELERPTSSREELPQSQVLRSSRWPRRR